MIEGFNHVGDVHKCNVCSCEFTEDEGGIEGNIGILTVSFCPNCLTGLLDMADQYGSDECEWQELTDGEAEQIVDDYWHDVDMFIEAIEAKLKEKNT